ncbi:MAG TPA: carbohydrate kinase [Sedimenticola sp.]|nr:carbohydrate kinase [Sedimenticola sp.]
MASILIIGSVAEDRVIFLRSPLREGAHLEGEERGRRLGGGAANTGGALAHAGHHVMPVCAIGNDPAGRWILDRLHAIHFDLTLVRTVEGLSTRSIVMLDSAGERTIINLSRAREAEPPARILDVPADCLFVRNRDPDLAPLLEARTRDCLVIAHMPPFAGESRPAQILVTSESDLEPEMQEDPFELGRRVAGDRLEWVIVTRGRLGASAYSANQRLSVPAPDAGVIDTTGAGDAFAAGLIHGLTAGQTMTRALETGCAWGAESTRWEASMLPCEAVGRLI